MFQVEWKSVDIIELHPKNKNKDSIWLNFRFMIMLHYDRV